MPDAIHLDFETYSPEDLEDVGAAKYIAHPDARIMIAAVALNDGPVYAWVHPDHESKLVKSDPRALAIMERWEDPDVMVYAHNAQFEAFACRYRLEQDVGIVAPKIDQWRCTQAMARRAAIPTKLKDAAAYLGLPEQKANGLPLIKLFSCPVKPTKKQPKTRLTGKDLPEKFREFVDYCKQDVATEREVHKCLRPFELTGAQLDTFIFDMKMNQRGIPVNKTALVNAQKIIDEVMADLGARFHELTGLKPSQIQKLTAWFKARGYPGKGLAADVVEKAIETMHKWAKGPKGAEVREALLLRQELGFSAVFKVSKMLACQVDGWVMGTFLFYGAGTGRWSAKLIQPQNFKKPTEKLKKHTQAAYADICGGVSREGISVLYGNPLDVISSSIRHFIQWDGGMLLQADYSSIEARIVCWLAGQDDAIQRVRDYDNKVPGAVEPYIHMASRIWPNLSIEELLAKGKDSFERFVGKQAVLGCGFGMGVLKFIASCLKYGVVLDSETAELTIQAYRKTYKEVAKLWTACERAARNAILNPGRTFSAGPLLKFTLVASCGTTFLVMKLPSGRNLVYPEPRIEAGGKYGDEITFYGKIEGKSFYGRIGTYGGKLVENATQATAADIMANGAVQADQDGFGVTALIHDEALALETTGKTLGQFIEVLTDLPAWAKGLPIVAEGGVIPFYKK